MTSFLHIHRKPVGLEGYLQEFCDEMTEQTDHLHHFVYAQALSPSIGYGELSYNYTDYDVFVIHSYPSVLVELVTSGIDLSGYDIVFVPHCNLIRGAKPDQWETAVKQSEQPIHVIVGSDRCYPGFPDYNQNNVYLYTAPTVGLTTPRRKSAPITLKKPGAVFDLFFFGRLIPSKGAHTVIEIANHVADQLETTVSVGLSGHVHSQFKNYVSDYCHSHAGVHVDETFLGTVDDDVLFELIQRSRAVVLPTTFPGETWAAKAWETIRFGGELFTTDWAGAGDAARYIGRDPWPVTRTKPLSDIPRTSASLEDTIASTPDDELLTAHGYEIDVEAAANDIATFFRNNPEHTRRDWVFPDQAHPRTFHNTLLEISNEEYGVYSLTEEFPDYVDYLGSSY